MDAEVKKRLTNIGNAFVDGFHVFALFAIGATVIWSAVVEYIKIVEAGYPTLKDILLLFIYLEVGAMVGIYFKTKRLPVVFLIFIAITALTRVITVDIKTMEWEKILVISAAILILAFAGMLVSSKNPFINRDRGSDKNTIKDDSDLC